MTKHEPHRFEGHHSRHRDGFTVCAVCDGMRWEDLHDGWAVLEAREAVTAGLRTFLVDLFSNVYALRRHDTLCVDGDVVLDDEQWEMIRPILTEAGHSAGLVDIWKSDD